ncbi:uncharacterized protein MYCGRDRAFT_88725 [Zymoseptoria tritici IPO323]|uniref:Uncharacterized protein n=1 Tax=Zymoseptoria tritici (strain CBS 115943 / IPO323) TaxID=336722 RepID=F9WXK3_ZYMTI|nr:uncharacterized protein MYCGRDRAFT_88725 [Zymoseptoria tritici IPO323]EGP92715.1 hypothetical protein MYCGRDRAFT_88725 [Zymoseptoria tritici IPO323]
MSNTTRTFEPTFEGKTLRELWAEQLPFVFDAPRRRAKATWTDNELIFVHFWYGKAGLWAIAWAIGRSYQALRNREHKFKKQVKNLDLAACPTKEVIIPGVRVPVDALREHLWREAPYEAAKAAETKVRLALNPRPKGNTRGLLPTKAKALGVKKTRGKKAAGKKTPTRKRSTATPVVAAAPASPLREANTDSAVWVDPITSRQYTGAEVRGGYLGLPAYQPPSMATMDATASAARGLLMLGQVNINSGSNNNGNAMGVSSRVSMEEAERERADEVARFRVFGPHGRPWEQ